MIGTWTDDGSRAFKVHELHETRQFMIGESSARRIPHDRITRLNLKLPATQEVGGFLVFLWRELDNSLETWVGLR